MHGFVQDKERTKKSINAKPQNTEKSEREMIWATRGYRFLLLLLLELLLSTFKMKIADRNAQKMKR